MSLSLLNNPLTNGFKRAFSIDYRTLALFRVILGGIIFVDLIFRSQYFSALFTDQGIIPRRLVVNAFGNSTFSLYFINGSPFFNAFLVVVAGLAALAMMAGYKTRVAVLISWVLLLSLHHRTGLLSSGADHLMRVLLFWAIFLPLGARFSLDYAMEKHSPYIHSKHFSMATFAILMQVMYVYWVGASLKTGAPWQTEHSAVFYVLNAEHYRTFIGAWVLDTFKPYLHIFTIFVYYIELYGSLFLISPFFLLFFRLPVLVLLMGMHVGFLLLLNVGHFPFVSLASLLLFLPTEVWQFIKQKWTDHRSQNINIYYDQECDFCLKTVHILKTFLILPNVTIEPAQLDKDAAPLLEKFDSWVIKTPTQGYLLEWDALVWLIGRSPIFFWARWPLGLLSKISLGNAIYHFIGNNRRSLGRITVLILPWRVSTGKTYKITPWFVGVLALMVLHINLVGMSAPFVPKELQVEKQLKYALGLWQRWGMFAPRSETTTRWPIIEGVTRDGRKVDVFHQTLEAPSRLKPENVLDDYDYYRWRKYYGRLSTRKYSRYRQSYVNYECRRWNHESRAKQDEIVSINLFMGIERTHIDGKIETVKIVSFRKYKCK